MLSFEPDEACGRVAQLRCEQIGKDLLLTLSAYRPRPLKFTTPSTHKTFAKNNMKAVATILMSLALFGTSSFAEDPKAALMDFVLPVPDNFVTSAAGALKARNETVTYYFKVQGIQFPEGSRVELDDTKKTIVARLPHREALNLIQIIDAFMGDSAAEWAKEFLEGGAIEGPENRCFGPLLK